ncbi:MAG TPA: hypothetical protein VN766_20040 [Stellaceae bacterium]|nr:hypothetical protein [Stellaceae bacterium]
MQELALKTAPVDLQRHGLQEIAARHRGDCAGDGGGRPQQVVDQRVDRGFHLAPGALRHAQLDAPPGAAFAADRLAHGFELMRHALIGGDDLIEGVGDFSRQPDPVMGQSHRKIADPHGLERAQHLLGIERRVGRHLADAVAIALSRSVLGG